MRTWTYPIGTVFLGIIFWHFAVVVFNIPDYLIPLPLNVCKYIFQKWNFLLHHSWITILETFIGFLLGVLIGVPLAIAIVWSKIAR